MKRRSIFFMLLLLQILLINCGCSSDSSQSQTETAQIQASVESKAAPVEGAAEAEETTGVFEGLEDNHTAIFSFDGAETVFHFEDEQVRTVLYEAVSGSSYTLSYCYDDSYGYVICEISE